MSKARIVVVEDEELVALAIRTYLERIGYDVPLVTPSGEEAVARLGEIQADLVLMDIRLEGKMNGIEAAAVIKDSYGVPVIYLTAYSDADTLEKAKMTEPFGYILKPYDERAMQATIKMALHKSEMQNDLRRTKEKMATILQSVGDGIIVTSTDGTVEYVNSTAQSLLDLAAPLPPGTTVYGLLNVLDGKTRASLALDLQGVAARGQGITAPNCILVTQSETSRTVDLSVEPYRDERGIIRGMVLAFRDVTGRTRIQELVDRELQNATDFHRSLLPPETMEDSGYLMSGFLLSASYGAGDIYNFFKIGESHLGFYIIDVMGHGISATSMALLLNRLLVPDSLRANRLTFLDADPYSPQRVVERLNDMFFGSGDQMFFTICYGVIERATKKLRLVRAGHPYPILRRRGGELQEVRAGGYAVGLARQIEALEFEVVLEPGDALFLYSDGLIECADSRSIQFSKEKLISLIDESLDQGLTDVVSRIKKEIVSWHGRPSFDDDISLLAIETGY